MHMCIYICLKIYIPINIYIYIQVYALRYICIYLHECLCTLEHQSPGVGETVIYHSSSANAISPTEPTNQLCSGTHLPHATPPSSGEGLSLFRQFDSPPSNEDGHQSAIKVSA